MNLITTTVSSNHYQWFLPTFVYTANRAYPNVDILIFIRGKCKVREILDKIGAHLTVIENYKTGIKDYASTNNILRYLIPNEYIKNYSYVLVRDVDILFTKHTVTHFKYMATRMKNMKTPYFSTKGPRRKPYRPHISSAGWCGDFTRIACGTLMLSKEWFLKTKKIREKYLRKMETEKIKPNYREFDEVSLYRICKKSGFLVPTRRNKYVDNHGCPKEYRDIHLGDFSKKRSKKRLKRGISKNAKQDYRMLIREKLWQEVTEVAYQSKDVRKELKRLQKTCV